MSHLKIINTSQSCIHKYENIKLCMIVLYIFYIIFQLVILHDPYASLHAVL